MIDPQELAAKLGVNISGGPGISPNGPAQSAPVDANAREKVDPIPPVVADALDKVRDYPTNRSDDSYYVVCCCHEAGLSLEQIRWVIDQDPDLADRVREFLARRPPVDDIAISLERARARNWMMAGVSVGTGSGGGAAPPWVTAGPGWFFDRTGLRVQDLADAVMSLVTCGWGTVNQKFYVYSDGVWTLDNGQIEAALAGLLGNRFRAAVASHVLPLIRHSPGTTCITDEPLADFINTPNGMLDWRTGSLLDHAPDYRSTVQLPVEYVPGARCPLFETFIAEVLPPDLFLPTADSPGFIWELIGYLIYSGNPHHVAILLYGKGRNGKGTLIRVFKALLGDRNCSSVGLHELIENRFRSATLYGKLANLAGDLDAKWLESTARFKAITGGDTIQGEYKYGAAFDFTPWALPFYSVNKAFGSADSSEGWVKRWCVVPFPNCFSGKEDRGLDEKLSSESELRGILRRGVEALPALMARGRFIEPRSLIDAKAAFITASDAVRAWVDEHCVIESGAWIPRNDLYRKYSWHAAVKAPKYSARASSTTGSSRLTECRHSRRWVFGASRGFAWRGRETCPRTCPGFCSGFKLVRELQASLGHLGQVLPISTYPRDLLPGVKGVKGVKRKG